MIGTITSFGTGTGGTGTRIGFDRRSAYFHRGR
jgi:hypothetical protein